MPRPEALELLSFEQTKFSNLKGKFLQEGMALGGWERLAVNSG